MINLKNQFDNECTYDEFVSNFRKLKCSIAFEDLLQIHKDNETKNIDSEIKSKRIIIDFTERTELLFKHEGINYYGHRDLVFEKIYVLNGLNDYSLNEPIILNANVPKYLMLLYIQSCYDGIFDVKDIEPNDFHQFLNLIDKYPTKCLSINLIEIPLIQYMFLNNIPFDTYIQGICNRYRLKYMYLYGNRSIIKKIE
jgi:hypothetical protein